MGKDIDDLTGKKKLSLKPEWVPDWPRILAGEPFHLRDLNEQQRHRIQEPLPQPTPDDELRADADGTIYEKREALRNSGQEIRYLSDGRSWWLDPEILRRAELRNFQRFDKEAAAQNEIIRQANA